MKDKTAKTFDGSACSVWQVIEHANTYFEFSKLFTDKLPASIHDLDVAAHRVDLAAASATNRILALELYLKALLIARRLPVPKEHDLVKLAAALPDDIRKVVKTQYDERNKASVVVGRPAALELIFSSGPNLNEKEQGILKKRGVRDDPSLSGLLVRNKDGFISSRYLFQIPRPNEITFFTYEHHRLALLCSVLCEGLESSLPNRPSSYQRHFRF